MKVFHVQIFADILDKERNNLYHNKESKITDMTQFFRVFCTGGRCRWVFFEFKM